MEKDREEPIGIFGKLEVEMGRTMGGGLVWDYLGEVGVFDSCQYYMRKEGHGRFAVYSNRTGWIEFELEDLVSIFDLEEAVVDLVQTSDKRSIQSKLFLTKSDLENIRRNIEENKE